MSAPATNARPAPVSSTPPTSSRDRLRRCLAQLADRGVVERVELVRPIDRDRGDAVGDGEGQELVGHAAWAGRELEPGDLRARAADSERGCHTPRARGPDFRHAPPAVLLLPPFETVSWSRTAVRCASSTSARCPSRRRDFDLCTLDEVVDAIRTLAVRGAPAIGVGGGDRARAVFARESAARDASSEHASARDTPNARCRARGRRFEAARPTAVNLRVGAAANAARALSRRATTHRRRCSCGASRGSNAHSRRGRADVRRDRTVGALAHRARARVLTHCNAGALATAGIGTALAPVYVAHAARRAFTVFADETRPLLQGARLTAWELQRAGIDVTVIPDGAAASLLRSGRDRRVIVGADRIAANGDVANKIGTYALALAARAHGSAVLCLRARQHDRRRHADGRRRSRSSSVTDEELAFAGATQVAAAARRDLQSCLRRHAARIDHALRHRSRPARAAVHRRCTADASSIATCSPSTRARPAPRALVMSADGRSLAAAIARSRSTIPQPGWVEHDADEIFDSTLEAAREAIAASRRRARRRSASPTSARRSCCGIARPGNRCIARSSGRTGAPPTRCARSSTPHAEPHRGKRTGLVIDPVLHRHQARVAARAAATCASARERGELAAGTIDSWLIWQLTGGAVHATDPTNASRTMLYDIERRDVERRAAARCSACRAALLPEVRSSSGDFGTTTADALRCDAADPRRRGRPAGGAVRAGWVEPAAARTRTAPAPSCCSTPATARPAAGDGLLTTVACDATGDPAYALEARDLHRRRGRAVAARRARDHRDGRRDRGAGALVSEQRRRVLRAGAGGLGAPHWEPDARGTIVGLTRGTTARTSRARRSKRWRTAPPTCSERCATDGGVPFDRLRVDGGATANDWLMQFQADVLGVPVERPEWSRRPRWARPGSRHRRRRLEDADGFSRPVGSRASCRAMAGGGARRTCRLAARGARGAVVGARSGLMPDRATRVCRSLGLGREWHAICSPVLFWLRSPLRCRRPPRCLRSRWCGRCGRRLNRRLNRMPRRRAALRSSPPGHLSKRSGGAPWRLRAPHDSPHTSPA